MHASPRLFHTQTHWLTHSLTHLVNWYVSHFKSYIHNDVFCISHCSCLHRSYVKGERSKLQCLWSLYLCNQLTGAHWSPAASVQIPLEMPRADRSTTVWWRDLWSLCFVVSLNSLRAVCWSLNTLFEELFIVSTLGSWLALMWRDGAGWNLPFCWVYKGSDELQLLILEINHRETRSPKVTVWKNLKNESLSN